MKGALLLFSILSISIQVPAQSVRQPVAVFYPAVTTYSTKWKDAFSLRANTAALAGIESFSAGVFSERRFLLEELSSYSLAAALPTSSGNFGLAADMFGSSLLRETTVGLAYARRLGKQLDVGLRFNYVGLTTAGYGSASTITFDGGALIRLTENVQLGAHFSNPVRMKFGKEGEERMPAVYSFGLGYDASDQLFIGAEIQKVEDQPVSLNASLQYLFAERLLARGGVSSATSVYYLGFGVMLKNLRVDATAAFHPYLGVTPGLLLIYNRPK